MSALDGRRTEIQTHQSKFAETRNLWIDSNPYFYNQIKDLLKFIIEPHRRVLNVRCQTGFFLEAVQPSFGVGTEVSPEMTRIAKNHYPHHQFFTANPEDLPLQQLYDYILFDSVSDTVDVLETFNNLRRLCYPHARLIIYTYNHMWQPIIRIAEKLQLKMPMGEQNWLSENDLKNLLYLADFEWLKTYRVVLSPKKVPILSDIANNILAHFPPFNKLCLVNVLIARPNPPERNPNNTSVSVIVPCKNEHGNIESAVNRIPAMGRHTEIIFCDDKSTDGTADEVRRMQALHPKRDIKLVDGPGICKAKNVWTGFEAAQEDILMILDADLTVMPEELPNFFKAIIDGNGEFINGSRLVYPMQEMAMKPANMMGNKFFGAVFSYLLDQTIKDTLCGTKVLWRADWQRIKSLLGSWGIEDRWGDYELLFGAGKRHLKIIDLPVHYQERVYGVTKMIRVFQNGMIMLRMCVAGFMKFKMRY